MEKQIVFDRAKEHSDIFFPSSFLPSMISAYPDRYSLLARGTRALQRVEPIHIAPSNRQRAFQPRPLVEQIANHSLDAASVGSDAPQ